MHKNTLFTGQPIFTQLLSLIPKEFVIRLAKEYKTDRYCKKFKTHDHLVAMLYASFHGCTSLREVTTGMQVCSTRLNHLGLTYIPRRSTLSDANLHRDEQVFARLYNELYRKYYPVLPDSHQKRKGIKDRLYIIDSTTMQLFSEIMKGAGCSPANGKRKGGMKAHVLMKANENVPQFVLLTPAASNDRNFLPHIHLPEGSIVAFDRGYGNFNIYQQWTKQKVTWVTRLVDYWICHTDRPTIVSEVEKQAGILCDEEVTIGNPMVKKVVKLKARKITFVDPLTGKQLVFITNNMKMKASTIARIYKGRWQIELLFKRLKQNFPLRYFLGDNENAIKIQFWCVLIADLLVKAVKDRLQRKWSFANIASMIRLHLMTYIDLFSFLNQPEKALLNYQPNGISTQILLFPT